MANSMQFFMFLYYQLVHARVYIYILRLAELDCNDYITRPLSPLAQVSCDLVKCIELLSLGVNTLYKSYYYFLVSKSFSFNWSYYKETLVSRDCILGYVKWRNNWKRNPDFVIRNVTQSSTYWATLRENVLFWQPCRISHNIWRIVWYVLFYFL